MKELCLSVLRKTSEASDGIRAVCGLHPALPWAVSFNQSKGRGRVLVNVFHLLLCRERCSEAYIPRGANLGS